MTSVNEPRGLLVHLHSGLLTSQIRAVLKCEGHVALKLVRVITYCDWEKECLKGRLSHWRSMQETPCLEQMLLLQGVLATLVF